MPCSRIRLPVSVWTSIAILLAASGCADCRLPRIDPSGEHLFIYDSPPLPPAAVACAPGTIAAPGPACPPVAVPAPVAQPSVFRPTVVNLPVVSPTSDVAVTLSPFRVVEPVGSQVVMLAGIRGGDGYLHTNRRLEWWILPGSVGQFTGIGNDGYTVADFLVGDYTHPRLISPTSAVGTTTRVEQRAGGPVNSVYVARGQGWVSISSLVEGESHVTVVAPEVVLPSERTRSATIYWIDAQFGLPTPAISPAGGKQSLTTTVLRQSNRCAHSGWIVRYELICGPPALFAPAETTLIEVPTNDAGQASVEIHQKDPLPGTSQVRVQVFRPADSCGGRLMVREASVLVTWTGPVSNAATANPRPALLPGPAPTPGPTPTPSPALPAVPLTEPAPATVLPPGQGLAGPPARPRPAAPPVLDLKVNAETAAVVGGTVTFDIELTNHGQTPATGIVLRDTYGEGLEHQQKSPITRALNDLAPGQSEKVAVTFRVTRPGHLCHHVEATTAQGSRIAEESCVAAGPAPSSPAPPASPPAAPPSPPAVPPSPPATTVVPPPSAPPVMPLEMRVAGPTKLTVGQTVVFTAQIINSGQQPALDVLVTEESDAVLVVVQATQGAQRRGNGLAWSFPSVAPGKPVTVQVQCECRQPAAKACCHFTAKPATGQLVEAQGCLEVAAAAPPPETPGRLNVRVDNLNKVTAGKDQQFLVQVTNQSDSADGDIVVTASIPPGSTVADQGTRGPSASVTFEKQPGVVRFSPVAQLPPGATINYRVAVTTSGSGSLSLQVKAASRRQTSPTIAEKTVDVLPAQ